MSLEETRCRCCRHRWAWARRRWSWRAHGAAGGPELPMPRHAAVLGVERENVQARLGGAAAAGDNDVVAQHGAPERPRPGRGWTT